MIARRSTGFTARQFTTLQPARGTEVFEIVERGINRAGSVRDGGRVGKTHRRIAVQNMDAEQLRERGRKNSFVRARRIFQETQTFRSNGCDDALLFRSTRTDLVP